MVSLGTIETPIVFRFFRRQARFGECRALTLQRLCTPQSASYRATNMVFAAAACSFRASACLPRRRYLAENSAGGPLPPYPSQALQDSELSIVAHDACRHDIRPATAWQCHHLRSLLSCCTTFCTTKFMAPCCDSTAS